MSKISGFTVIELIIVIIVVSILLGLSGANLRSSLAKGRDEERKADTSNITNYLDTAYNTGYSNLSSLKGSYPGRAHLDNTAKIEQIFADLDKKNLQAPNVTGSTYSLVVATNTTQTTAGILPSPTIDQYVYQPLKSDESLCLLVTDECRKFNMFYRLENDNTVYKLSSKNR